jgi:hypothetical protein
MQNGQTLNHSSHLVKRFFGYLVAHPLTDEERAEIAGMLPTPLATLFFGMQPQDQRHAYEVYLRSGGGHLTQAALLHDVGKSVARIGPISRSLATLSAGISLPVRGNWVLYLDHGRIGADLLEQSGADALAVAFTRHHPGPTPPGIDQADWQTLTEADET